MYTADLHIHSRYSRATSRDGTPEQLDLWARRKGIHIVGTGDLTHPAWREELREKLVCAEDGLYQLKEEYRISDPNCPNNMIPRFVISGEISSIYKKYGKVRKVHSLILLPGFESAELISRKLEEIGNIHSDGRPILGLDCRDLLEIVLELCPEAMYVPAHIWTPHFSLFGAFSGFDTIEECFGDLTGHIHALETGLSSDPPMNWRVSALDRYQLISNSDAHSPAKLGREANLLDCELSYRGLKRAIETGEGLYGTIEFFPEEGKYHFDGHRKCNLCLAPSESERYGGICPVCGRKITIGVSHRVEQLADRAEGYRKPDAKKFESLVPLPEVIAAATGHSAAGMKVQKEYFHMLQKLGSEFEILREIPVEEIRCVSGRMIADGIARLRAGEVERIPGFDGEYGSIRLFRRSELEDTDGQLDFFSLLTSEENEAAAAETAAARESESFGGSAREYGGKPEEAQTSVPQTDISGPVSNSLNARQQSAVRAQQRRIAVVAGPGTGKTKTLVSHIIYLLEARKVKASEITAVTFTNQAASEMRGRIRGEIGKRRQLNAMQIGTFHAICLSFLKSQGMDFILADDAVSSELAARALKASGLKMPVRKFLEEVSAGKSGAAECRRDECLEEAVRTYMEMQRVGNLLDFDDLLLKTIRLIEQGRAQKGWEKPFSYLLVDEFQDINPLQYRLMCAWNQAGRELFVIGDPDQSIYGFRGADAQCFDRLSRDYEGLEVIRLEENYRCTPQILKAVLGVISGNPGGERILRPNCASSVPVRLAQAGTKMGEAIFAAKEINRMAGGIGMLEAHEAAENQPERKIRSFDEIAVLCRTHREAELVEKCLRQEGIPYIAAGRESFLEDEAVVRTLAFFRSVLNPGDIVSREQCLPLLVPDMANRSLRLEGEESANPVADAVFGERAQKYAPLCAKQKPGKILKQWIGEMHLEKNSAVQKLYDMTVFYKSMEELLSAVSLGVESDLKRCGGRNYTSGAVTLMTLHGSKGLEFPVVMICGARKGMIPFESEKHPADIEEERRLFYVGMTRAKEELIITSSGEESEFFSAIPEDVMVREQADKRKKSGEYHQMSLFEL